MFDADVEQVPIRKGFGEGFLIAGDNNEQVVGICADLTESTMMHLFRDKFPNRFVQVGVAEQNLATVASGMAAMGKIPFISSYAMFSPGRNWEQIRTTICYNDRPVKIAGSHAGISVGPDGGTHQAIEDIAITRVIPNMCVISPVDAVQAKLATIACAITPTPTYLRLVREKTAIMTTEKTPFEIGKSYIYWQPMNNNIATVGIIATGALVHKALLAAAELEKENIYVVVLALPTIKPLDTDGVLEFIKNNGNKLNGIVTVEEHQIAGGMGSAIAEFLVQNNPLPMRFVGVKDKFGQSGKPEELIEHYGMGTKDIIKAVKELL
ncbi:transketolase [Candidatus Nomurabacteria bacterium RIFCSPHIGHO2_02_FULL_33_12]|uniref:Transketolase n=1 Tax=Candidatus Nomurabacteria bacterium RIFCSPLOWO2_01_FULL_33_17 TaxID=1801764 RepID=A0A1F6WQJ8_9BACT|nr:MAG: transketolase [Candidatus Nomurabacteria bacterium RIFCSPHIGHO2_02_FULL_33_12]OGI84136.1 MAG: transketolase [Candidatus Nomurabacteria bacterium RIFCSPLOWO2_01_FULL_33_17]